jgi:hypothetical protein
MEDNIKVTINKYIVVTVNGQDYKGRSKAEIYKKIGISANTVNNWSKKGFALEAAIKKAILAKNKTILREIVIFNKKFKDLSEACLDNIVNKLKLPIKTIQVRVRKGMTPEEALSTPLKKPRFEFFEITLPNRIIIKADSIKGIIKEYKNAGFNPPKYSTVVRRLERGESIEAALGLIPLSWLLKKQKEIEPLITKGYKVIGELKPDGQPIIIDSMKQIYPSVKEFSKSYNFSSDSVYKKLKKEEKTPDEIIKFYDKKR